MLSRRTGRTVAAAVLFDRDGTLIVDVPFNTDPQLVTPMPHAGIALERLRRAGIATAVVTNQSGLALGRVRAGDVAAINARMEKLIGPVGPILMCAHVESDACDCRKPAPGLIIAASRLLGISAADCVVIGDIGADLDAARAAGARAVLVATPETLPAEIAAAPFAAVDLSLAVDAVLSGAV